MEYSVSFTLTYGVKVWSNSIALRVRERNPRYILMKNTPNQKITTNKNGVHNG